MRNPMLDRKTFVLLPFAAALGAKASAGDAGGFVHPGGLHNRDDLERMKAKVAARETPWIEDWNRLIADPLAQATYRPGANANMGVSRQRASRDAHAAYLNAIRWYISGDSQFADCAIRICNAWSAVVDQPPRGADIPGLNAIPTAEFALVGELLRVCPAWKAEDFARFQNMMLTYWYPPVHQFLIEQNGPGNTRFWANWNLCSIGACIAIGVLCDRRDIFDEGVRYYTAKDGTGSILNVVYFVHPSGLGQWQEAGRDQSHAQLGVGLSAQFCEVAWKQGVDLYGLFDNRLLMGAEYVAQWNLWKPVPYKYYTNSDHANQSWPSINARGRLKMPLWELVFNHYAVRKGLSAPNVEAAARLVRPEGGGGDHFGYGTLTFTLDAKRSPYPPAPIPPPPTGLVAEPGIGRVFLRWNRSGDTAQGYRVQRATARGGPYETVAEWNDETRCEQTDLKVVAGTTYYYTVAAQNQAGVSEPCSSVAATPAAVGTLPEEWQASPVGAATIASVGFADVSGGTFLLGGAGKGIGSAADNASFAYRAMTGDATITARLADAGWHGGRNQKIGIMMRESIQPGAPAVVMKLGDLGVRQAGFGGRPKGGDTMKWAGGNDYTSLPAWFRLTRVGQEFTAFESSDGETWFRVGTNRVEMGDSYLVGLTIASDGAAEDTAYFDHVSLTNAAGGVINRVRGGQRNVDADQKGGNP